MTGGFRNPIQDSVGTGDVVGPASSTDGAPALFDGTSGKLLKNSTPTGTGNPVLATSPTLVTPLLGTPTSGTLTNCGGLPLTTGVTGILTSANGGTGNGFTKFSGPTTAEKTFTLPDASSTLLYDGGALGTPASGTATNITGLPLTGLVNDTSTALGVGSIELGHASDTSITRVSAGVVAVEGVNLVTASSTDTLTNKTFDANGTGNSLSNVDVADLAAGTDGELITWDASGNPTTVPVGTATHVLTSNGVGAAPTFQAPAGGGASNGFDAKKSGNTALAATATTIVFNTENFDTSGNYDNTTGIYTAPSAGVYVFHVNVMVDGTANDLIEVNIVKNSTDDSTFRINAQSNAKSHGYSRVMSLAQNDTVKVTVENTAAARGSIYGGSFTSSFGGCKLY